VKTNLPPSHIAPQPKATAIPSLPVVKSLTHIVAAGETLAAIARKSRVNLNALLAANPGLNPRKLRVGQVINLPPP
jgi:LysM repeat protein